MKLTYKNSSYEVELIKRTLCTSTQIEVCVFRCLAPAPSINGKYFTTVRRYHQGPQCPSDTLHFLCNYELHNAISNYLDYICQYA